MASSEDLRRNKQQHKPKNIHSKQDDKAIFGAMQMVIEYLNKRFVDQLQGYELCFDKAISYKYMIESIKQQRLRSEFDINFMGRTIKPDGGMISLNRQGDNRVGKIILISEIKKQGTNKQREAEGKPRQAQGNAIERLGKNLTGIRAMMNHERITPFVCFGWGCDFIEEYGDDFVMSKVSMLNQFYPLNKIYVHKRDGNSNMDSFAPVSMYFREKPWTQKEMFNILKEVAETSLRYYLF